MRKTLSALCCRVFEMQTSHHGHYSEIADKFEMPKRS
jgi:hypothetical protein